MIEPELVFLKLGGSLITDKDAPLTPRPETIARISQEIASASKANPTLKLLIGHGSGSFGHAVASQYQTQLGEQNPTYWQGFIEVWRAARELNQIMIRSLSDADLPVLAFPPSAGVIAKGRHLHSWDIAPIQIALLHGIVPVVAGDVIFDQALGGTIFSTEELFHYLAEKLRPTRILLAGLDQGVYQDPQHPEKIIPQITPALIDEIEPVLQGSASADVTGGMLSKVQWMLSLVAKLPQLKVQIFSGAEPGNIQKALAGIELGTIISY